MGALALLVFLSVGVSGLFSPQAQAANVSVNNLYEAWVPVADQSEASREAGFKQGLEMVLKRVTGKAHVSALPEGAELIKQVDSLVSQFNYRAFPEEDRTEDWQRYYLQVSFNENALNGLLRKASLPIWSASRPPVLFWIAHEEAGRREILGSDTPSMLKDGIGKAAQGWGVPVIYPLHDFEDALALATSDLWGLFVDPIQQASRRYGVNSIMAVRVWPSIKGEGFVNARSLFLFQRQAISNDYRDISTQDLADKLMTTAAGQMGSYYAVAADGSPGRPVRVMVDGVDSVSEYANVLNYFDGLTAVRGVLPVKVRGSQVLLEVNIDGSMEQLRAIIDLDRKLSAVRMPTDEAGAINGDISADWLADFEYRWTR